MCPSCSMATTAGQSAGTAEAVLAGRATLGLEVLGALSGFLGTLAFVITLDAINFGSGYFPQQGWGWAIDYPGADCKFMWGVQRLTNIRVYDKSPHLVTALDPKLFQYPYLYIVSPHRMYLTSEEAQMLREYLLRGGFLHIDDFWGLEQRGAVEEEMSKIFPDRQMGKLSLDHKVFHTFFDVDTVMQIPNVNNACSGRRTWEQRSEIDPMIFGISDDAGRLMVLITYNYDLGDAWEWMDLECYPQEYTGQAYRMGLNFMIYAATH